MNLKRRFALFGFGFAAGIIIVIFILNGKDASCNYLPNARMLEIMRSKHRVYTDGVKQIMETNAIDSASVAEILLKGDIDFSKSKTRQEPCRYYWIDGYLLQKEASIYVENCDTIVTIQQIHLQPNKSN